MILGLIFAWKVALVAMACTPFLVSAGYIRLVRRKAYFSRLLANLAHCSGWSSLKTNKIRKLTKNQRSWHAKQRDRFAQSLPLHEKRIVVISTARAWRNLSASRIGRLSGVTLFLRPRRPSPSSSSRWSFGSDRFWCPIRNIVYSGSLSVSW